MAVRLRPQGIVSLVGGQVDRTLLRAEEKCAGEKFAGRPSGGVEHGVDCLGLARNESLALGVAVNEPQLHEGADGCAKVFRRRSLVHAVGAGHIPIREHARHGLVSEKHRLLNQAGRSRARTHGHTRGMPLLIEGDLWLHGVEVDRATLLANALAKAANAVKSVQRPLQRLGVFRVLMQRRGIRAAGKQGIHGVVVKACRRPYGRGHGLGRDEAPLRVKLHAHAHCQPVLARPQRAHVVAEALGKHG